MADAQTSEKLTLGEAFKDLGWFPLALAVIVGGPSILAILETVFVDHQLVPALQWIVDGYNRVMAVLGGVVEPLIQPAIDWVNAQLNWRLTLDPVWRPLFALGMVVVLGGARTLWRDGQRGRAIPYGVFVGIGVVVGAALAGITPVDGGWWAQGLRATAPMTSLILMLGFTSAALQLADGDKAGAGQKLRTGVGGALSSGLVAFALAAGLSFVPGLGAGAAVLALGGFVALMGFGWLANGLSGLGVRSEARLGLTVLGGFIAAGLVLAADFGLKALGAG